MKNAKHILLLLLLFTLSQAAVAINYPTYRGPSIERGNDNSQIYVPMQSSPLPKPSAGYSASSGTSLYSAQSTAGGALGQTESNKSLKSYGGGGSGSGATSGGSHSDNSSTVAGGSGAGGSFSAMPRVKSLSEGSRFDNEGAVALADGYAPTALRNDGMTPPPGPNPDPHAQLPLGNGIVALMLCCAVYVAAKRRKNNE